MANEFIIRKGYKSLASSEVTGSLTLIGDYESIRALTINSTKGSGTEHYFRTHGVNGDTLAIYSGGNRVLSIDSNSIGVLGSISGSTYYGDGSNLTNVTATSFTETDTLATVTGRGATTSTAVTLGEVKTTSQVAIQDTTFQPLSSLFEGTLTVRGSTNEDPIIAITDSNTANAAAGVFHQSSTSPGFPALVINAASNGSEQPLISARTNVNNTTGTGGTEVFAVDGDGDATFAGDVTANNLSGTNTGDQTLPTDFVSKASGGTFGNALAINHSAFTGLTLTRSTVNGSNIDFNNSGGLLGRTGFLSDGTFAITNSTIGTSNMMSLTSTGDATFAGDVTVAGTLTAQEFHTEFVSASILYESGSTKFGDTSDDIHSFSGSLRVTGSGDHYFTDGNVGIGTTSPATKLNIDIGTGGTNGIAGLRIGGTNNYASLELGVYGAYGGMVRSYGNDLHYFSGHWRTIGNTASENHSHYWYTSKSGSADWSTVKMELDHDGNLGIGTTSPDAALHIVGKQIIQAGANAAPQSTDYLFIGGDDLGSADASIYIGNRGDDTGYGWRLYYKGVGSGNLNKFAIRSENLGSPVDVMDFEQDGTITLGGYGEGLLKTNSSGVVSLATASDIPNLSYLPLAGGTMTGTITSTLDGIALTMDGGVSAEGIRMTADSTTTYPVFLRSIAAGNGETSPWLYKENNAAWGIWHNNPINSFDFTRASNNLGIENNVGGQTNSVMIRLNNTDGSGIFKGNVTATTFIGALTGTAATASYVDYSNLAGTVPTWNQNTTGNAATATTASYALTGPFLSSYTETDTLATVAGRGASTTTQLVLNGGVQILSGTGGGKLRIKRNSGSSDGDDITDIHMDDGGIYFDIDNDGDGDSGNVAFRYKAGGTFTNSLAFTNSVISYKGNTIWHAGNDGPTSGLAAQTAATASYVDYSNLAGTVPTWNQNTTGNAATADTASYVDYSNLAGTIPTWNQDTTGNAATATTATNADTASYVDYSNLAGTIPTWNQDTTGNAATATTASHALTGPFLSSYSETDTLASVTGRGASTTTSVRFSNDLNYFGLASTNNEGEIIINTGEAGSPQIGFTEHGDASWAIGIDDSDNSFKMHGVASAAIPTLNNLATPLFELTTTAGTAYLNGSTILHTGNYTSTLDGRYYTETEADSRFVNVTGDTMTGALTVTDGATGILVDSTTHASLRIDRGSTSYDSNLLFYTAGALDFRIWQDGSSDYLYVRDETGGGGNMVTFKKGGNVGIGTSNPGKKLHVYSTGNEVAFFQGTSGGAWIDFQSSTSNLWSLGAVDANGMGIYNRTAASYPLVIKNGGNVGIGTTTPSSKLEVYGSGSTILDIQGSQGQLFSVTDDLTGTLFSVSDISGIPIFEVDASGESSFDGNVGIGTTSPSEKLTVDGNISATGTITGSNLSGTNTGDQDLSGYSLTSHNHDDRYYTETESDSRFVNVTGDTMTGNLTVGSTARAANTVIRALSSDAYNAGFEAYGNSQGTGYLYVGQSSAYGGGISYNGDGAPAFAAGESSDRITFFRRTAGNTSEVFSYAHNSDAVAFNGDISANNLSGTNTGDQDLSGYSLTSHNHDDRYYTETESDSRFVNVTGDTMTGDLTLNNSGQGWIKGYDAYHSIKFRAGGTNKTEYYEYGGTLADGLGHKFFTGGTTGQTLKFQVADDGSYFSGNVGIGTTDPTNGKLVINSTTNQIAIETGTAGDGRLNIGHFSNGTFIGTYGDDGGAADLIRFGTHSGDERMRITSAGNVGIGPNALDTAGGDRLHVDGTLRVGPYFSSNDRDFIKLVPHGSDTKIISPNERFHIENTGGDVIITTVSSGGVGIGTTSPSYKTDVINTNSNQTTLDSLTFRARSENYAGTVAAFENNSGVSTSIRISDTVDDMYVVSRNGIMGLGASGGWSSNNLNIKSNGYVGIGNRNPSARLHVKGGNIRVDSGNGIDFYDGPSLKGSINPFSSILNISSTYKIAFRTGGTQTEKMRLTDDGRLLLNTPDDASAYNSRFEAIGSSADASTNMTFKTSGRLGLGDYDPVAKITVVGSTNDVTSNLIQIKNTSNGGSVIDFRNSGNGQAGKISMPTSTTVNYGTTSDYRLKTNVVGLENGIEKVKKLKPSRFEWIENGIEVDGFIAHEVAEVVPEAVTGVKDAVDENNDPVYQDLDYSKVIPVLTAALKEAIQKIELLETRIQTLENN